MHVDDLPKKLKATYPNNKKWINKGQSCIINPFGELIAGPLDSGEGIIYANINLQDILIHKRNFDVVGHYARPDVFNFSVNK